MAQARGARTITRRGLRKAPRPKSSSPNLSELQDDELTITVSDDTGESSCDVTPSIEISIHEMIVDVVDQQQQKLLRSTVCGLRHGLMCLEGLRRSSSASRSSEHRGHYHGGGMDAGYDDDDDDDDYDAVSKSNTHQTVAVSASCSTDSSTASHGDSDFYEGAVGTVLEGKYRIVSELGRGTFGRVVECHYVDPTHFMEQIGLGHWRGSVRPKTSGVYAVKIARNKPYYARDAEIEADMLRRVNGTGGRGTDLFPLLADHFRLPEGHSCLVFEKLGMSLHDIIQKNEDHPFDMTCVREVAVQLFDALDHVHSLGIVHTDLKPENILLVDNNADEFDRRIKVIDFGSACLDKDKNKARTVNTRQYRAPEILLRIGWSYPSDIWAAGCTVAELHLGSLLFPAKNDAEHLALIEKTVDPFPRYMVRRSAKLAGPSGPTKNFDFAQSRHKLGDVGPPFLHLMDGVLSPESAAFVNKSVDLLQLAGREGVESGLCDLLKAVFSIDPNRRPTAAKALKLASRIKGSRISSP